MTPDRDLPPLLARVHQLEFYDEDADADLDYWPLQEFETAEETTDWIRAWTGNDDLDGSRFRVFASDASGGVAAFWLVHEGRPVEQQPIVFFGSEGTLGVVAVDLADYVWMLAQGVGPLEAIEFDALPGFRPPGLLELATELLRDAKKSPEEILERARERHPGFEEWIRSLCR